MISYRCLASPLLGTLAVLVGFGLLAIPLHRLTAKSDRATAEQPADPATGPTAVAAVLRLRLLAPAQRFSIRDATGRILLESTNLQAGESEHDVMIRIENGQVALSIDADFAETQTATAVFLTVMPDGLDEQTRFVIGSGRIGQVVIFSWPPTTTGS